MPTSSTVGVAMSTAMISNIGSRPNGECSNDIEDNPRKADSFWQAWKVVADSLDQCRRYRSGAALTTDATRQLFLVSCQPGELDRQCRRAETDQELRHQAREHARLENRNRPAVNLNEAVIPELPHGRADGFTAAADQVGHFLVG